MFLSTGITLTITHQKKKNNKKNYSDSSKYWFVVVSLSLLCSHSHTYGERCHRNTWWVDFECVFVYQSPSSHIESRRTYRTRFGVYFSTVAVIFGICVWMCHRMPLDGRRCSVRPVPNGILIQLQVKQSWAIEPNCSDQKFDRSVFLVCLFANNWDDESNTSSAGIEFNTLPK